ncbi:hypothetical protein HBI56_102140 [Parastagonospora nodorum]|uniref:Uncharacterized protein n=1 Tax=Phaeosphaeria nodorum (strain SN15 / ATCC MYA-4574 / FGSC 10173) TaxID=321614 RepID=A0A7U2FAC3_PHANO|nr:hypothetical protein HBH56_031090 [Parastagonospora nodorum]QRC99334.1 hypothetical protein JI435_304790 [Parastagonospora nodorum SN15]KAH3934437.1 hypothetical protein HBH54_050920 [Parastagonospora nodorum]KAH3942994.1 hypothetical protein HBH53_179750 [Parastagonospora nodorum]KAH3956632.1 hypothetical protein HBH51_238270 [Parastagonospora nodorum]
MQADVQRPQSQGVVPSGLLQRNQGWKQIESGWQERLKLYLACCGTLFGKLSARRSSGICRTPRLRQWAISSGGVDSRRDDGRCAETIANAPASCI